MGQHKTNPIAIANKKRRDQLKEKDEYKDIDDKPWKNMSITIIANKKVN